MRSHQSSFSLRFKLVVAAFVLVGAVATSFAINPQGWFSRRAAIQPVATLNSGAVVEVAQQAVRQGLLNAKLAIQPEANRMRRRLGNRFLTQGNSISTLVGTLTIGGQSQMVRIVRGYGENGESVAIERTGNLPTLSWNDNTGALANGVKATGETRLLIERLALDSADQFVLAQLRGASYRTIARNARPAEAGGNDSYQGPVWDLILIGEPKRLADKAPTSTSRQYYVNASTGLVDRVVSQENGQTITAELSGWTQVGSERFATKIVWQQASQKLMELVVNNAGIGNRQ